MDLDGCTEPLAEVAVCYSDEQHVALTLAQRFKAQA